jgi:hypothetical protein
MYVMLDLPCRKLLVAVWGAEPHHPCAFTALLALLLLSLLLLLLPPLQEVAVVLLGPQDHLAAKSRRRTGLRSSASGRSRKTWLLTSRPSFRRRSTW